MAQKHYNATIIRYFALASPYSKQVLGNTVPGCWDPRIFVLVEGGDVSTVHPAVIVDCLGRLLWVAQISFWERKWYNSQDTNKCMIHSAGHRIEIL